MAASIFKLVGSIFVENNEANKNIEETGKKAEKTSSKLASAVGTAAKWGAGVATAAGGAATALFGTAKAAADSLDAVQKGAQKMGLSYENYQKLAYAADRSGASIDNLSKGMKNISKDMAEVASGNEEAMATYENLGVSIQNADGSMRSAEDIMMDSLMALSDLTDETERNAAAQEIFGNGYTELIPLMTSGSDGIKDLMQNAQDLGLVMSNESVDAGAAFGDALADLKDSLGSVVTKIGAGLLPMMTNVIDWIKRHLPQIKEFIGNVYQTVQGFVEGVVGFVRWLWAMIEPYIPIIVEKVQVLVGQIIGFWNEHLKPMMTAIIGFVRDVLWPSIQIVLDKIKPYLEVFMDFVSGIVKSIKKQFTGIIDFLTGVFTGDWKKAWNGITTFLSGIFDGLVNAVKMPLNVIIEGINGFIRYINTLEVPDWVPVVGGMGFHFNEIPLLAKGGQIAQAGNAIVGEAGAEMISLPAGATVTPLNNNNNAFVETNKKLDALISVVKDMTAQMSGMGVYINGNALIGEIAPGMDSALGTFARRAQRGV